MTDYTHQIETYVSLLREQTKILRRAITNGAYDKGEIVGHVTPKMEAELSKLERLLKEIRKQEHTKH
jgi:hypothetical protein